MDGSCILPDWKSKTFGILSEPSKPFLSCFIKSSKHYESVFNPCRRILFACRWNYYHFTNNDQLFALNGWVSQLFSFIWKQNFNGRAWKSDCYKSQVWNFNNYLLDYFFTRSFQQINLFDQTYHMTRSYAAENSFISKRMRTQGNSYACWAFSCATMIRAECRRNIKFLFRNRMISETTQKGCFDYMSNEQIHTEMRNLLMIILLPKKLHENGPGQSAHLRAAISRVSLAWLGKTNYLSSPIQLCCKKKEYFSWSQLTISFLEWWTICTFWKKQFRCLTKHIAILTRKPQCNATSFR